VEVPVGSNIRIEAAAGAKGLVGALVGVPDVLAGHLRDPDVVVVDLGDDPRAPEGVEPLQCLGQQDRLGGGGSWGPVTAEVGAEVRAHVTIVAPHHVW
jgi:hypothetical protein